MSLCPRELRKRYRECRIIPFIGAGISSSVRWGENNNTCGPTWYELVNQAIEIMGFQSPELARVRGTDLQILEYFKLINNGQTAKLTNWLSRLMVPPDEALKSAEIYAALAKLNNCKLYYTTNFDDFLERGLSLNSRLVTVSAVEADMGKDIADAEIVKFHGDLNHPDRIVLTESDFERRLKLSSPMDYRLQADLLGRVILFLGYSFRDPNVSYLFRLFTENLRDEASTLSGPRAYIAIPDPSDFEVRLFEERKIQVIPINGNNKEHDIVTLLDEMVK